LCHAKKVLIDRKTGFLTTVDLVRQMHHKAVKPRVGVLKYDTPSQGDPSMSRILGLMLAGGLMFGATRDANAQVAVSVGNPFVGSGVYVGAGGYPAYGAPYVAAAPVVTYPAYPAVGLGFGYSAYRPVYGGYAYRPYGGYGYRPYGGYYHRGYRRW
jgi:hypothetical protein